MNEQNNVHVVQQAYAAFKRGDINAVLASIAPDADWHLPGPADIVPVLGKRHGRDQIGEFFAKLAELQEAELFEPREFISNGEKVVVLGEYRWRVRSTGRTFSSDWAHVFTVQDGKVTRFQEYFNTDAAVQAYQPAAVH